MQVSTLEQHIARGETGLMDFADGPALLTKTRGYLLVFADGEILGRMFTSNHPILQSNGPMGCRSAPDPSSTSRKKSELSLYPSPSQGLTNFRNLKTMHLRICGWGSIHIARASWTGKAHGTDDYISCDLPAMAWWKKGCAGQQHAVYYISHCSPRGRR